MTSLLGIGPFILTGGGDGVVRRSSPFSLLPSTRNHRRQPLTFAQRLHALPSDAELADTIVIAGGGPAGLAAALALQKIGAKTLVLEGSASLPTSGAALGLWTNAWRALDALGAGDALRSMHPAISNVELCRDNGRRLRNFSLNDCDGGPHEFRGVRRASLVQALAEQMPDGCIEFNADVVAVRPLSSSSSSSSLDNRTNSGGGAEVELRDGRVVRCSAVIGCDGARSTTATALGKAPPNYVGQVAIRGVADISTMRSYLTPAEQAQNLFPPENLPGSIRQIWGAGVRAGNYPLSSSELYWFVCFDAAADAPLPSTPAMIKQEAERVLAGWGWGVEAAVKATSTENISRSRFVDRWDLPPPSSSSSSSFNAANVIVGTVCGDALHPMTPNLGQGGCTALEDGVVLAQAVRRSGALQYNNSSSNMTTTTTSRGEAFQRAFLEYEQQRASRCLPLTVRSHLMGAALQLPWPPVVAARDAFVSTAFNPAHFLDHASFDCGSLV